MIRKGGFFLDSGSGTDFLASGSCDNFAGVGSSVKKSPPSTMVSIAFIRSRAACDFMTYPLAPTRLTAPASS
jgi:hypothetical protein